MTGLFSHGPTPLANTLDGAIQAFTASDLSAALGDMFSTSYLSMAAAEVAHAAENGDAEDVNDWERARYLEFS